MEKIHLKGRRVFTVYIFCMALFYVLDLRKGSLIGFGFTLLFLVAAINLLRQESWVRIVLIISSWALLIFYGLVIASVTRELLQKEGYKVLSALSLPLAFYYCLPLMFNVVYLSHPTVKKWFISAVDGQNS